MVLAGRWPVRGELGGGVFSFPALSFSDGVQQQHRPGWHVGIGGGGTFPPVRSVVGAVGRLDAGLVEELPYEFAPFSAVIIKGFVRPFAGDQDTPSGDAQVLRPVCLALAASRGHGVAGTLGLDAVAQPDRAAW